MLLLLAALAQVAIGDWAISEKQSKLDGQTTYSAVIESNEEIASILDRPKKATLSVDCSAGRTTLMLDWPDFIDREYDQDSVAVSWKIDQGQVQATSMIAVTSAVGLTGRRGRDWLHQLSSGRSLVVSLPDKHGGQEVTFTLDGTAAVEARIIELNCN